MTCGWLPLASSWCRVGIAALVAAIVGCHFRRGEHHRLASLGHSSTATTAVERVLSLHLVSDGWERASRTPLVASSGSVGTAHGCSSYHRERAY